MTLYQIEDGLAQLIAHRAERLADKAEPPGAEELAALEGEINKYQIAEPVKVARVAAMFRMWKAQRANIKDEIARLREADGFIDACEARLKERVAAALELLPEPAKGCRKLSGAEGSVLSLKGNGGVEPLQVDGWDSENRKWTSNTVLPYEYQIITIKMPFDLWTNHISRYNTGEVLPDGVDFSGTMQPGTPEPNGAAIRRDLADGEGVPGARLLERSSHVEIK